MIILCMYVYLYIPPYPLTKVLAGAILRYSFSTAINEYQRLSSPNIALRWKNSARCCLLIRMMSSPCCAATQVKKRKKRSPSTTTVTDSSYVFIQYVVGFAYLKRGVGMYKSKSPLTAIALVSVSSKTGPFVPCLFDEVSGI